jgi:hypothetical protein
MGKALSRNQASYAAPDAIAIAMESLNTLAARLVDAGLKESLIAHFKYLKPHPFSISYSRRASAGWLNLPSSIA